MTMKSNGLPSERNEQQKAMEITDTMKGSGTQDMSDLTLGGR